MLGKLLRAAFRRAPDQQIAGRLDRGQRSAQVMAEQRDELLALMASGALVGQRRTCGLLLLLGFDLQRQQAREGFEHCARCRAGQVAWQRIERTERTEETAVGAQHRHRDIAFEAIHLRRVMVAVIGVGADLADDDRLLRGMDLAAQRGGDVQLAADLQAELDAIEYGAGGPARLGDAGNRSEAQASGFADHLQDGRDGADALDGEQVVEDGSHHLQALSDVKRPATLTWPTSAAGAGQPSGAGCTARASNGWLRISP